MKENCKNKCIECKHPGDCRFTECDCECSNCNCCDNCDCDTYEKYKGLETGESFGI